MKKEFILKDFLVRGLRRLSYKWPGRSQAMAKARIKRGLYKCAICEQTFSRKEVVVDHIEPVIDIEKGFTDWNDFISRLFCDINNLQVICKEDHKVKTFLEKQLRRQYKNDKKVDNK